METIAQIDIEAVDEQTVPLAIVIENGQQRFFSMTNKKPRLSISVMSNNNQVIKLRCKVLWGVEGLHNTYDIGYVELDLNSGDKKRIYKPLRVGLKPNGYTHFSFQVTAFSSKQTDSQNFALELKSNEEQKVRPFKLLDITSIKAKMIKAGLYSGTPSKQPNQTGSMIIYHMLKMLDKKPKDRLMPLGTLPMYNVYTTDFDRKIIYQKLTLGSHEFSHLHSVAKPIINERFTVTSAVVQLPTGEALIGAGSSSDLVVNNRGIYIINHRQRTGYLVAVLPIYLKKHTMKLIDGVLYVFGGYKDAETTLSKRVYSYNLKSQLWGDMKELSAGSLLLAVGNSEVLIGVGVTSGPFYYFDLSKKLNWEKKDLAESVPQYTFIQTIFENNKEAFFVARGVNAKTIFVLRLNFTELEMTLVKTWEVKDHNIDVNIMANGQLYFANKDKNKLHFFNISDLIDEKITELVLGTYSCNIMSQCLQDSGVLGSRDPSIFVTNRYNFADYPFDGFYMQSCNNLMWYGDRKLFKSVAYDFNLHIQNSNASDNEDLSNLAICAIDDGTLMMVYGGTNDLYQKCSLVTGSGKIGLEAPLSNRKMAHLISHGESVYYIGGYNQKDEAINSVEIFDCLKGSWTRNMPISITLGACKSAVIGHKICIFFRDANCSKLLIKNLDTLEEDVQVIKNLETAEIPSVNLFATKKILIIVKTVFDGKNLITDITYYDIYTKETSSINLTTSTEIKDIRESSNEIRLLSHDRAAHKLLMSKIDLINRVDDVGKISKGFDVIQEIELSSDVSTEKGFKLFLSSAERTKMDKFFYYRYNKFKGIDDVHKKIALFADGDVFLYNTNLNNVEKLKGGRLVNKLSSFSFVQDGRVINCGGQDSRGAASDEIWVYNYFTQKWQICASRLSTPRYNHKSIIKDGKLLILGGYDNQNQPIHKNEFILLNNMKVYEFTPFNTPRAEFGLLAMGERVIALQGYDGTKNIPSFEYYSDDENRWIEVDNPNIGFKLRAITAVKFNYKTIMVIGGIHDDGTPNFKWRAIPLYNLFNKLSSMESNHKFLSTESFGSDIFKANSKLFIIGGNTEQVTQKYKLNPDGLDAQQNNINGKVAKPIAKLGFLKGYSNVNACYIDIKTNIDSYDLQHNPDFDKLYMFRTLPIKQIIRLNLKNYKWQELKFPDKLELQEHAIAKTLPNGDIFYGGGMRSVDSTYSNTCYILTPQDNTLVCKLIPPMFQKRYTFSVAYLEGYIYIIGGRFSGSVS